MERINEHDLPYRAGTSGPKYLFHGPLHEWGVVRLLPGQTVGQHYHNEVEETFYFPQCAPLMIVNDERLRVRPGDAFRLSPTERHDVVNDTDQVADFIIIKCPYLPEDKVSS